VAPVTLKRPPRDVRLDVLRGWLQVSIFIAHAFGAIYFWGIHASWGVSDSSEQFVLLSGLALGSVFTLKRARDGFGAALRDLGMRIRKLYLTHLLVFALFAAMVFWMRMTAPVPPEAVGWGWLAEQPLRAIGGTLVLLYQPAFMDILPLFVFCMLLLAPFLWLLERMGDRALLFPLGLYGTTQLTGLNLPGLGGTEIGFNPFSWQVLFLLGAWCGRRALLGAPPLEGAAEKPILGPLRLAHALALAWLVAVLVPRDAPWMHGAVPRVLALIGQHSLHVFCLGLFLSWGVATALALHPAGAWWLELVLMPVGVAALAGFAAVLDRRRLAGRRLARA